MNYSTSQLAKLVNVHVNTIRFYEEIGFITKPFREKNGYRTFNDIHYYECQIIALALRAEVLQNGLRQKAIMIIKDCAQLDFNQALLDLLLYQQAIKNEIDLAYKAINYVKDSLDINIINDQLLTRLEIANILNVSYETIRTWERNGLLNEPFYKKGKRLYNQNDLNRLNIIKTLRCSNYSLSAILRLLNKLDKNKTSDVNYITKVLDTPEDNEDIISVCDKLISSLNNTYNDTLNLFILINKTKEIYQPSSNTPTIDFMV